ncbi:MAG: bifunctional 4-hydroxy-2-oxoglutarate aldolase/2-dehydro-3-deoxy-phosphogluconate aldolase [Clostridia bacterium]|nr:bifunctional 4-hydroxy-2-oxoglutarate aldolase/2-dehydro-3-deoxy-phosphogluconate aldolase [Clostridia bacterium]
MTVFDKIDGVVDELYKVGIVPVIKLEKTANAVKLAAALRDGGINCAEVTYRAKGADEVIREMVKAFPDMIVGAGTVLTCEQADAAFKAGAKFCVAPGLNAKVVKHCLESGIPFAPGLSSASEVENALELGLSFAKFFPAEQAGGLAYIKSLAGPYSQMRFMPTGGVTADNIGSYLAYDKIVCCGGSWIVPEKLLMAEDWDGITALCEEAVNKMLGFKLVHIGINQPDEASAIKVADKFENAFGFTKRVGSSSVFASDYIEVMKKPFHGAMGHIAIGTNSIERALYQLHLRGVEPKADSLKYDEKSGKIKVAYLEDMDFGGFAVHFVLNK